MRSAKPDGRRVWSLDLESESVRARQASKRRCSAAVRTALLVLGAVLGAGAWAERSAARRAPIPSSLLATSSSSSPLLHLDRGRAVRPGAGYAWLGDGEIAEPSREVTLTVPDGVSAPAAWRIERTDTDSPSTHRVVKASARSVTVVFGAAPSTYAVHATASGGASAARLTVHCRYVRRELRSLPPSELAAYLDAFEVLTNTSTADGRAAYGPSYRSLDDFVRMHLLAAGRRVSSRGGAPCATRSRTIRPIVAMRTSLMSSLRIAIVRLLIGTPSPPPLAAHPTLRTATARTTGSGSSRTTWPSRRPWRRPSRPWIRPCPSRTGTTPWTASGPSTPPPPPRKRPPARAPGAESTAPTSGRACGPTRPCGGPPRSGRRRPTASP